MYEIFVKNTVEAVKKLLGEGFDVRVEKVHKTNDIFLDALCIIEETPSTNLTPTIYLEHLFDQFVLGTEIEAIAEEIVSLYNSNHMESFDITSYLDFDNVKEKVCYKIVNTNSNRQLLSTCPHRDFLDLSILYYVPVRSFKDFSCSILIHNSHIACWEITEDELFFWAEKNTAKLNPVSFLNLNFTELTEITPAPITNESAHPMFVLTNSARSFGAATILYSETLSKLSQFGKNLWLIPSSTDEWIFIPDTGDIDKEQFAIIIKDVNKTTVEPTQVLSDHLYYFDCKTQQITM